MKKWIYICMALFLSACGPEDPIIIEKGHLADSALVFVPYVDGEIYSFKHSDGQVINYTASRETFEKQTYGGPWSNTLINYEVNKTELVPDYPIFNLLFTIDNFNLPYYQTNASIGKFGFNIPTEENVLQYYYEMFDSLEINTKVYYDVFKLSSIDNSYVIQDSIHADSLFYNYEYGVLKVIMSNKESYEIVE